MWFTMYILSAKSVQSPSLSLESVDDVHGGDGLPLGVLGVCHGITDDVLKENFQNSAGLLVDQSRYSLHTATASKTADSWLGYSLYVIS